MPGFRPSGEWRSGWRVVAGAAVGMGTGVSLYLLVMSLFVVHISGEFGWTRGDMGVAGMVAFGSGALALPILGRLVDRVGFRRVVIVCVPALAAVYVLMALQPGLYRIHLLLAVCGGAFGAGTGGIPYTRPVIAAFDQHRGLALGLATAGTSVVAMIVPPILAEAIATQGWRTGLYVMAVITAIVGLPVALALVGREREGMLEAGPNSAVRSVPAVVDRTRQGTLPGAARSIRFWLLVTALVSINIPGSGVVSQLAPLLGDKGLPARSTAAVMSIYAVGLLVGRVVTGLSLDRCPAAVVAAVVTIIPAFGAGLLLTASPSFMWAAVAVALFGVQQGSEVDLIAYFVSDGFGQQHYGAIYGAIGMAGALSTACALVFFGKVHDLTGSYDAALRVGAGAFVIGAMSFGAIGLIRGR